MANNKNHDCVRCGEPAQIVQNVYIDGAVKKVSYCKKCFVEMLNFESERYVKVGVKTIVNHMNLVQETPVKDGSFEKSFEDIYSVLPSTIQLSMFKHDTSSYRNISTDIKKRRLVLLSHRLKKALRKENYKKALKIKRMMDEINETLKQQPW